MRGLRPPGPSPAPGYRQTVAGVAGLPFEGFWAAPATTRDRRYQGDHHDSRSSEVAQQPFRNAARQARHNAARTPRTAGLVRRRRLPGARRHGGGSTALGSGNQSASVRLISRDSAPRVRHQAVGNPGGPQQLFCSTTRVAEPMAPSASRHASSRSMYAVSGRAQPSYQSACCSPSR